MATYRVWLTVKDAYGNTKEVDGGLINVDLDSFSQEELEQIEEALPLKDYIKKTELNVELDDYATDKEVEHAVKNAGSIRYSDFELQEDINENSEE